MEEYLSSKRGQKVRIRVPKKGSKEKMVELAERNAQIVLDQDRERIKREEGRTVGAVKEIARWLNLPSIDRIEAYDISNISGFQSVGSMIVYEKGKPKRADYRKFKIKSVEGPNDYASMKEVLSRRFLRGIQEDSGFERLPDLIMMDGGRGQVNIALEVLEEMDLAIPVCGMVKDDKHRTRGLYFRNVEIPIDRNQRGLQTDHTRAGRGAPLCNRIPPPAAEQRPGPLDSRRHPGHRADKKERTDAPLSGN